MKIEDFKSKLQQEIGIHQLKVSYKERYERNYQVIITSVYNKFVGTFNFDETDNIITDVVLTDYFTTCYYLCQAINKVAQYGL